eukprot:745917-Hanusia_phi.AAC.1
MPESDPTESPGPDLRRCALWAIVVIRHSGGRSGAPARPVDLCARFRLASDTVNDLHKGVGVIHWSGVQGEWGSKLSMCTLLFNL